MSETNGTPTYAIRLHHRARIDIDTAILRLAEFSSEKAAVDWHNGLFDALATLAVRPGRCPLVRENRLFSSDVRQHLYSQTPGGPTYRILFTIRESVDEAPFVFVLHIRHGARGPITRSEARSIEAE